MPIAGPGARVGRFEVTATAGERIRSFVPPPLPPDPPLDLIRLQGRIERADQALGRLDGVVSILPNTALFLYIYVRKEALLSSQIEGTQSSLSDLLLREADGVLGAPLDDVEEVSSYVRAMTHGLDRLREGFPLTLRLLREIHAVLLTGARGQDKSPGEFRRSQNWIGGTRPGNALYVPPPPHLVQTCMGELETFLHADTPGFATIVKAGLVHVQFESIHLFLDGNGRLGRPLIALLLSERQVLREPLLYLSLYLKQHRARYYELLQAVRERGAWEEWLEFFLDGVAETASLGAETARRILALFEDDRRRLSGLGRASSSVLRVHQALQKSPFLSVPAAAASLSLSQPTIAKAVRLMQGLGMVREVTGRQRGRLFVYDAYLAILSEGTEPLPR